MGMQGTAVVLALLQQHCQAGGHCGMWRGLAVRWCPAFPTCVPGSPHYGYSQLPLLVQTVYSLVKLMEEGSWAGKCKCAREEVAWQHFTIPNMKTRINNGGKRNGRRKKWVGWRKKRYLCIDFIVSVPSQMCLTSLTLFGIFITESLS